MSADPRAPAGAEVIGFPRQKRPKAASTPAVPLIESGRYIFAQCAQLGYVPQQYWEGFLELAQLIREQQ